MIQLTQPRTVTQSCLSKGHKQDGLSIDLQAIDSIVDGPFSHLKLRFRNRKIKGQVIALPPLKYPIKTTSAYFHF